MAAARLVYHGLISVPLGHRRPGIYWLRLYLCGSDKAVIVLTEVPGNPSYSLSNGMSGILNEVVSRFDLSSKQMDVFQVTPIGAPGQPVSADVDRVSFAVSGPAWRRSTRAEIEKLVGSRLVALPSNAELYEAVLKAGGGNVREDLRYVFAGVPVKELPAPRNLFRCPLFADRSKAERSHLRRADGGDEPGRTFWENMTVEGVRACPRHSSNWKAIAEASVEVIEAVGLSAATEDYIQTAEGKELDDDDRHWLLSLFTEPIIVIGGDYTDGQHRACALRFSGAARAAVVVDEKSLGSVVDDWTYGGDG